MDEHTFFRANNVNLPENQRTADIFPGYSSLTETDAEPGESKKRERFTIICFEIIRFILFL